MRPPSRHMPPAPEPSAEWDLASIGVMLLFCAFMAWPALSWWPLAFFFPAIFTIGTLICSRRDKRIAESRRDYSICDFARSFDYRIIDTWIIRAVFDEFSYSYPVRPDDNLENDLSIDDEDLYYSVEAIAKRAGRSMDETENNPMYYKVETICDLVMFLQYQPKIAVHETVSG